MEEGAPAAAAAAGRAAEGPRPGRWTGGRRGTGGARAALPRRLLRLPPLAALAVLLGLAPVLYWEVQWQQAAGPGPGPAAAGAGSSSSRAAADATIPGALGDFLKAPEREPTAPAAGASAAADVSRRDKKLEKGAPLEPPELGAEAMDRKRRAQDFEKFALPPLESILADAGNGTAALVGDPQPLLHFVVAGFGKCGTTTALHLLRGHSQLQALQSEIYALYRDQLPRLLRRLHEKLPLALPRGYKCPGELQSAHSLRHLRDLFPKTKLVVGVRHPVLWYQSLYNFRVQNLVEYESLPPPNQTLGPCTKAMKMCCAQYGHFAHLLMRLGKQRLLWDEQQTQLVGEPAAGRRREPYRVAPGSLEHNISHWYDPPGGRSRWAYETWDRDLYRRPLPNPVFLFELGQLGDGNATRKKQFRADLARFLGVSPGGFAPVQVDASPGIRWGDAAEQARRDARKIDICDPRHLPARAELVRVSRASSVWIRTVFLKSPTVFASNSWGQLDELLETWMHDPCEPQAKE